MGKIEYGKEIYEWDYDPIRGRINIWKDDEGIVSWQDCENHWGNPDYGDAEEQVWDLIDGYYEEKAITREGDPLRLHREKC